MEHLKLSAFLHTVFYFSGHCTLCSRGTRNGLGTRLPANGSQFFHIGIGKPFCRENEMEEMRYMCSKNGVVDVSAGPGRVSVRRVEAPEGATRSDICCGSNSDLPTKSLRCDWWVRRLLLPNSLVSLSSASTFVSFTQIFASLIDWTLWPTKSITRHCRRMQAPW